MIRKLRKTLKPIIWIFVITFIATLGYAGASSGGGRKKTAVLKINGKKLGQLKVERAFANNIDSMQRSGLKKIDREASNLLTLNGMIEQEILKKASKDLKIKISMKEVNKQYAEMTSGITDKKELQKRLSMAGLTIKSLKDEIKDSLLVSRVVEEIRKEYKEVPEKEMKEYYEDAKYNLFKGMTYEEAKEQVEKNLLKLNQNRHYRTWIEGKVNETTVEFIDKRYEKYEKKIAFEYKGYKVTNLDLTNVATSKLMNRQFKDFELAKKDSEKTYKENIYIAKKAEAEGLKTEEKLGLDDKLQDLITQYRKKLASNYKYKEKDLKAYFNKNPKVYDVKKSANAKLIYKTYKVSETDRLATKPEAESILKQALAGKNFAKLAKKYSQDPGSKTKGGDLGWFDKKAMVKEFTEAAFNGAKGKVYPKLIKTSYGYHIIKVEDKKSDGSQVKARHILIMDKAGALSKKEANDAIDKVLSEIKSGKSFDEFMKNSDLNIKEEIKDIREGGYISGRLFDKELSEAIFVLKAGELKKIELEKGIYIIKRTKKIDFKKAIFTNVKEAVKFDFLYEKSSEELKKIREQAKEEIKKETKKIEVKKEILENK